MYKVIYDEFYDMKDKTKHVYQKGDVFPFDNRKISQKKNRRTKYRKQQNRSSFN